MAGSKPLTRKELKERRQTLIGVGLLVIVLAVAGSGLVLKRRAALERAKVDAATHCPTAGPASVTVVLIDQTDRLNERQQAFIRNELLAVQEAIPKYGKVYIYGFGADREHLLQPGLEACNPGRGADTDPLTGSARRAESVWKASFQDPVQAVMNAAIEPAGAASSPILEAVQSISIGALQPRRNADKQRELVIVSDMLHFTPEHSHYGATPDFDAFRSTAYYARVRTNLTGVMVRVLYVGRPSAAARQGRKHAEFWGRIFRDDGAADVTITWVEG